MRIVGGLVLIALVALAVLAFTGSTPAEPKTPPYGDPKEKREKPTGKTDGKGPAAAPKFDPDSVPEATLLTPAMDLSIVLPKADMALPVPKALLERSILVIRASKDGWLPAYVLPEKRFVPVKDWEALNLLLYRRAEAAGREPEPPRASNLDVLMLIDHRASWARCALTHQAGADPTVRVWRYWLGTRTADGKLGVLPWFMPKDRGLARPPDAEILAKVVKRRVQIEAKKGTGGFDSRELLYRWCYDLWAGSGKRQVGFSLAVDPTTPYEGAIAVLNEVRRFSFGFTYRFRPPSLDPKPTAAKRFFVVGDAVPEIDRVIPCPQPGVVLGKTRLRGSFPWTEKDWSDD